MTLNAVTVALQLRDLIDEAESVVDADTAYWQRLDCGQDTEQAEASGHLTGQVAGLRAALALIADGTDAAEACLELDKSVYEENE